MFTKHSHIKKFDAWAKSAKNPSKKQEDIPNKNINHIKRLQDSTETNGIDKKLIEWV